MQSVDLLSEANGTLIHEIVQLETNNGQPLKQSRKQDQRETTVFSTLYLSDTIIENYEMNTEP